VESVVEGYRWWEWTSLNGLRGGSKKKIAALKAEAEHFGNLSGFYQERMNQAQSPDDAPFKPEFYGDV